ncbi:murein hydrolase activator EnvC family protein [Streptomyces sp. NBC_00989]|uniref:murein hydrolase activator EnvC family protein n=1 Tax=Streptomyces sp. NBC_00989 TaxID=2903705 RepID=UPI0038685956|nr:M23 family metallopeptidase [Streptomyces sp. NBC_00989]
MRMRRNDRTARTGPALLLTLFLTLLTCTARANDSPPPTPGVPAPSVPAIARTWPVGSHPPVLRGWEPPATPYARGHRGVDLATPAGTEVRAVAAGRVSFAGRVAGRGVVSVELAGTDLRTTYEPVSATVKKGAEVKPGEVVGTVEVTGSHCATTCVHWGLLRGETYLNPLELLPPWLLNRGPSRLLPVLGAPL